MEGRKRYRFSFKPLTRHACGKVETGKEKTEKTITKFLHQIIDEPKAKVEDYAVQEFRVRFFSFLRRLQTAKDGPRRPIC